MLLVTRSARFFVAFCVLPHLVFPQERADSVCQILTHLAKFSGKTIAVRARIDGGIMLVAEDCSAKIRVGQFDFQNMIALYWPDSAVVTASRFKAPFSTDEASRSLLYSAVEARGGAASRLYAVVEGLIVTRNPPLALTLKSNPNVRLGFGQSAVAPAAIIVKRISDLAVSREREGGSKEGVPASPKR
jgi:hypothetical protein